jgi:transposase-like protein
VNTLIEESGLSPAGEPKTKLKTSRKKAGAEAVALVCPKCGSGHVGKNGSAHGKSRFLCKDCGIVLNRYAVA